MEKCAYYQKLTKFSLFNAHFVFLDTEDYLTDGLFIKHQVRVHFGDEFVNPTTSYRIIFCHVRKRDEARFRAAIEELPNKMLLFGHTDYLDTCFDVWKKLTKAREERRVSHGADGAAEQAQ